jgi:hypothetical protein
MRWYVSIGVLLAMGAMAGDVAVNAAPQAPPRVAQTKPADITVDVELVLAVDISYSMDIEELTVQREGYAQAIVSKEFLQALKAGPTGKVAVTYFEWAASTDQKLIIPMAHHRWAGIGRRGCGRNSQDAGTPCVTHLDFRGNQFRDAAV